MAITLKTAKQSAAGALHAWAQAQDPPLDDYPQVDGKIVVEVDGETIELPIKLTAAIRSGHGYVRPELDSESSVAVRKGATGWDRVADNEEEATSFKEAFLDGDAKTKAKIEADLENKLRKDHAAHMKDYPEWEITSYRQGIPKVAKKGTPTGGTQAPADEPAEAENES